jgi:hypothetical protein
MIMRNPRYSCNEENVRLSKFLESYFFLEYKDMVRDKIHYAIQNWAYTYNSFLCVIHFLLPCLAQYKTGLMSPLQP